MDATCANIPISVQSPSERGQWRRFKKIMRAPFRLFKQCFQGCLSEATAGVSNTGHCLETPASAAATTPVTLATADVKSVEVTQVAAENNDVEVVKATPADTVSAGFVAATDSKSTEAAAPTPSVLPHQQAEPMPSLAQDILRTSSFVQAGSQRQALTSPCSPSEKPRSFIFNHSAPHLFMVSSPVTPPSRTQAPATPTGLAQSVRRGTGLSLSSVIEGSDVVVVADYSLTTGWDDPDSLVSCKVGEVLAPQNLAVYEDSYKGKSFTVKGNIGKGAFGTVVLAEDDLGRKVALKAQPSVEKKGEWARERLSREIAAQSTVRHRNSVQLLATFSDGPRFFLVLEYACNGSLSCRIAKEGGTGLDPSFAARVTFEVANALQALHSNGFVHRDIKPGNIVLGEKDDARVCDYGICGIAGSTGPCVTYCGTKEYCAPEVTGDEAYGEAVDLWSLGVVVFEMLTGDLPFENGGWARRGGVVEPPAESSVDASALDLVQRLLRFDPSDRMPLSEVCAHPWVVQNGGRTE